jgi:hypothetical protein
VVSEEDDKGAVDSKNIKWDHIEEGNETRTLIKDIKKRQSHFFRTYIWKEQIEHSDNWQYFREERQGQTTEEDFGWTGKLAGVNHRNDK